MEVFCIALDKAFWHIWQLAPGADNWSGWKSLDGQALKTSGATKKEKQRKEVNQNPDEVYSNMLHQRSEEMMNGAAMNR